jgi:glycosyltransferase involved in cell wall biosynthesis
MFPVDDPVALATAIDALARDRARRRRLAEVNRARAWDFRASESDRKLEAFYRAVRDTAGRHRRFLSPRPARPRS